MDELLRVGYQIPHDRDQQGNRGADGGTPQKDPRFHQTELHIPQPWYLYKSDHRLAYRRDLWFEMVGYQHRQRHNYREPHH